jgi:membrane protease YdiL (CAAX protease family)
VIRGWIDVTAFMITGLCAEEFLFRGALFGLAQQVFGKRSLLKLPVPVIYSAFFFAAQHIQYHVQGSADSYATT